MFVRVLFLICFLSAFAGCKNEPYETGALSIVSFANKESTGTTLTYTYAAGKLSKFNSKNSTATLANMVFYYTVAGRLDHITSDSTELSYKRTEFIYDGVTATDNTFLFASNTKTLTATRVVTYDDSNEHPLQVKTTTWTNNIPTEEKVDLTWENGNIARVFTTTTTNGIVSLKDMIASYDDKNSIYTSRKEYLYTFTSKDFIRLSVNNPVMTNDGTGEKPFAYSYNKLGYPSVYVNNVGATYGMTYSQVK